MKLSDLNSEDIEIVKPATSGLKLSEIDPSEIETIEAPSKTESGLRGVAQGASAGFADELTGGIEALWEKAKGDPTAFGELYKQKRDESRANYKAAELANPKTYIGGQIGGAVGSSFVPGLGGANVAKMAALGAAQGLGSSEADLTEGDIGGALKDTAIGGTIGGVTGLAGKGLGQLVDRGAEAAAPGIMSAAEDIANPLANLPGKSHSTIPGKMFGASNYAEDVLNAAGNVPESIGAGIRETAKSASEKDLGGVISGLSKGLGGGKGGFIEAVSGASQPRMPNTNSLGQRAADVALGSFATPAKGFVLPTAAASKIASKGIGTANEGVRRTAVNLTTESVPEIAAKMGKYGKVLTDAASRGAQSLGATHFVLQQTDPQYREVYKQATGESDESEQ